MSLFSNESKFNYSEISRNAIEKFRSEKYYANLLIIIWSAARTYAKFENYRGVINLFALHIIILYLIV